MHIYFHLVNLHNKIKKQILFSTVRKMSFDEDMGGQRGTRSREDGCDDKGKGTGRVRGMGKEAVHQQNNFCWKLTK